MHNVKVRSDRAWIRGSKSDGVSLISTVNRSAIVRPRDTIDYLSNITYIFFLCTWKASCCLRSRRNGQLLRWQRLHLSSHKRFDAHRQMIFCDHYPVIRVFLFKTIHVFIKNKIFSCRVNKVIDLRPIELGMCFVCLTFFALVWFVCVKTMLRIGPKSLCHWCVADFVVIHLAVVIYCLWRFYFAFWSVDLNLMINCWLIWYDSDCLDNRMMIQIG